MCEIGGKGYTHRDMIRDVSPAFILIGECVNVLIWGEGGDRVVVPVPVGGTGVGGGSVNPAARSEGSYRGKVKIVIEAIKPR